MCNLRDFAQLQAELDIMKAELRRDLGVLPPLLSLVFDQVYFGLQLRNPRKLSFEISSHFLDDLATFGQEIDHAVEFGPRYVHSA